MARAQQARKETAPQRKRLVLVTSEKGGVGKSVTARTFVEYLREGGTRVAAYDADGSVGGLVRVLGTRDGAGEVLDEQDPAIGVGYYNIRDAAESHTLLNCLGTQEPLIVHDLAGGSLADLTRITDMGEGLDDLLVAVDENGYRLTVLHLISSRSPRPTRSPAGSSWSETGSIMSPSATPAGARPSPISPSGTATPTATVRSGAAKSANACCRTSAALRSAFPPCRPARSPRSMPTTCRSRQRPPRRA
ncbi:hypothetical protein ACRAWG_39115 (plasmid) [Methylobacterium sp. P31]